MHGSDLESTRGCPCRNAQGHRGDAPRARPPHLVVLDSVLFDSEPRRVSPSLLAIKPYCATHPRGRSTAGSRRRRGGCARPESIREASITRRPNLSSEAARDEQWRQFYPDETPRIRDAEPGRHATSAGARVSRTRAMIAIDAASRDGHLPARPRAARLGRSRARGRSLAASDIGCRGDSHAGWTHAPTDTTLGPGGLHEGGWT
jgi:hypothetical protein